MLQYWAWKNCRSAINIVVVRLAMISILRNLFSENRIFIVIHNYDKDDGKSFALRFYYNLLFLLLRIYKTSRINIVVVSPYFKKYFEKRLNSRVLLFPNFFDTGLLTSFETKNKKNRIHLGQWSAKNSDEIFTLAALLKQNNYESYFSSLDSNMENKYMNYGIRYFDTYDRYLSAMAESLYTIAFPKVQEGWNRVAHESVLVGTNLIGFDQGGLGDLLRESNMFIVSSAAEALKLIMENRQTRPNDNFYKKYDINNATNYLNETSNIE